MRIERETIRKLGNRVKVYYYETAQEYLEECNSTRHLVATFKSPGDADIFLSVWKPTYGYLVRVV